MAATAGEFGAVLAVTAKTVTAWGGKVMIVNSAAPRQAAGRVETAARILSDHSRDVARDVAMAAIIAVLKAKSGRANRQNPPRGRVIWPALALILRKVPPAGTS